jgi:hypothetical protein
MFPAECDEGQARLRVTVVETSRRPRSLAPLESRLTYHVRCLRENATDPDAIVTGAMKSGAKWCPVTFCAHMKVFANNRDCESRDYHLKSRFPLTRQEEGDRVWKARIHGWPPMGSPSQGTLGQCKA